MNATYKRVDQLTVYQLRREYLRKKNAKLTIRVYLGVSSCLEEKNSKNIACLPFSYISLSFHLIPEDIGRT